MGHLKIAFLTHCRKSSSKQSNTPSWKLPCFYNNSDTSPNKFLKDSVAQNSENSEKSTKSIRFQIYKICYLPRKKIQRLEITPKLIKVEHQLLVYIMANFDAIVCHISSSTEGAEFFLVFCNDVFWRNQNNFGTNIRNDYIVCTQLCFIHLD